MLSLAELRRVAGALDAHFVGMRIEKIVQPGESDAKGAGDTSIVFSLYGRGRDDDAPRKRHLLLSCHPALGRIAELERAPGAPARPPHFTQWLRSRLGGGRLAGVELVGDDREIALHLDVKGEDATRRWTLLLSLIGRRANLYLIDSSERIAVAQRPYDQTRKDLSDGAAWSSPPGGARAREDSGGDDRFADVAADALLHAIEAAYAGRETSHASEGLGRRLAKALGKERKQAQRRLERVEAELAEADEANQWQHRGELLKTALGELEPGQREVRVEDPASGETVAIELDPSLGPKQNLDAIFKRAQKLMRRLAKAGAQVEAARGRVAEIDGWLAELEALGDGAANADGDAAALEALAARPPIAKLVGKREASAAVARKEKPKPAGPFKDLPTRLHPRRYRSADGLEIWVGRSDEANDHLTTRLARGKDLFFHVEDSPGSHVILRTEGRSDPPAESLLDACELAVHFSKLRKASHAEVHAVPIKNVKKPKGAKPGLVYVTGGKSIRLRREESRLQRLLDARIES